MNDYNASTLIKAIQSYFALNQEEAGRLVLEPAAKQPSVNVDVDGKMVTNLVKLKKDIHQTIKSATVIPEVLPAAKNYIQEHIIRKYIDFVFGGDDYIKKSKEVHRNLDPHYIKFKFEFAGEPY